MELGVPVLVHPWCTPCVPVPRVMPEPFQRSYSVFTPAQMVSEVGAGLLLSLCTSV